MKIELVLGFKKRQIKNIYSELYLLKGNLDDDFSSTSGIIHVMEVSWIGLEKKTLESIYASERSKK